MGKKESTRTNTGRRGSRGVQLTRLEKILLGGGALRNINKPNAGRKDRSSSGRG